MPTYTVIGKKGDTEVAKQLAKRLERMLPGKITFPRLSQSKGRRKMKTVRHNLAQH